MFVSRDTTMSVPGLSQYCSLTLAAAFSSNRTMTSLRRHLAIASASDVSTIVFAGIRYNISSFSFRLLKVCAEIEYIATAYHQDNDARQQDDELVVVGE